MLLGIVFRGSAFAFRSFGYQSGTATTRWSLIFAVSSVITPFMLGVTIGAVPTETQVMVKREDEQAFAELNAANPIFVEDAARSFAAVLLAVAAVIGMAWESTLVYAGIVSYPGYAANVPLAPYWIVAMWVLFATTLNMGMRWMRKSLVLASVMGAIGGPLSFLAGEKAGAVVFPDSSAALVAIGLGWAVLLPLLVGYAIRSDKQAVTAA